MPHHPSANTQNTQGVQNSFDSMESIAVYWHNRSLRDFLNTHIELVNQLHRSLNSEPNASVPSFVRRVSVVPLQAPVPLLSVLPSPATAKATEAEEIMTFAQQFSVIVVFVRPYSNCSFAQTSLMVVQSTFAAGVIIAYLQLMNDVLPAADEQNYPSATIHRELGFGMGFAGLVWNLAIATVAGANTAACASGRPWKSIEGIRSRFTAFLVAQFLGAVMFGACVGILMYPVHSGHGLVALPMAILPTSIFIAATDVASTSQEFRMLKADVKKSMSSFFRRLCCCGGQRRRRF
jgi:hypothetical protein